MAPSFCTTETQYGKLEGLEMDGVSVFKGIPYGKNTGGEYRFKPPQEPLPWAGTRRATEYGATALQAPIRRNSLFNWLNCQAPSSEDCLNLNIYTPSNDSKKRPVMVYLHGGAFSYGSSSAQILDGSNFAKSQDIVVVTLNHRLGITAHLCSGQASESEFGDSSNSGILDIIQALKWVKNNISVFGGDPNNVTIFGQSGGGAKVALLMRAPLSKGLFQRAIIQSTASGFYAQSVDEALKATHQVLQHFNLPSQQFRALCAVSPLALVEAMKAVTLKNNGFDYFRPINDDRTLLSDESINWKPQVEEKVPVLIGYTHTEAAYYLSMNPGSFNLDIHEAIRRLKKFTHYPNDVLNDLINIYKSEHGNLTPSELLCQIAGDHMFRMPTLNTAEQLAQTGASRVYMYKFGLTPSLQHSLLGSPHTIELPFIFGNIHKADGLIDNNATNNQVMTDMMQAWANFARSGDPSTHAINWPEFDTNERKTMVFDTETKVKEDPDQAVRIALNSHPPYTPGNPINYWQ